MSDFAGALAALREKFLVRAVGDLRDLRAWSARGAPPDADMQRLIHRLAGAAGTFGFDEVGRLAKRIDARLALGKPARPADASGLIEALGVLPERAGRSAAAPQLPSAG